MMAVQAVNQAYLAAPVTQHTDDLQQSQRLKPEVISGKIIYPGITNRSIKYLTVYCNSCKI
jgi:hypothetical protein